MPSAQPKAALVTGAARGIGLATAKKFLAEGWHVALLDIEGGLLAAATADIGRPDETLALMITGAHASVFFNWTLSDNLHFT